MIESVSRPRVLLDPRRAHCRQHTIKHTQSQPQLPSSVNVALHPESLASKTISQRFALRIREIVDGNTNRLMNSSTAGEFRQCVDCKETLHLETFLHGISACTCNHLTQICWICVLRHFRLTSTSALLIQCPSEGCKLLIHPSDAQRLTRLEEIIQAFFKHLDRPWMDEIRMQRKIMWQLHILPRPIQHESGLQSSSTPSTSSKIHKFSTRSIPTHTEIPGQVAKLQHPLCLLPVRTPGNFSTTILPPHIVRRQVLADLTSLRPTSRSVEKRPENYDLMRRKAIRASFRPTSTSELIQDAMNTPPMAQERVQSNYKVVISSPRTILTPASCVATTKCLICQDDLPKASFPAQPITGTCVHPSEICTSCLVRHVETEVPEGRVRCPVTTCRVVLSYFDVQRIATPGVLERYDEILLRQELQKDPNFLWCQNPECESGQIHSRGVAAPLMICHSCNFSSCFKHELPEIPPQEVRRNTFLSKLKHKMSRRNMKQATQEEPKVQACIHCGMDLGSREIDEATQKFIKEQTKPCPSCHRPIEKSSGCDHMTCRPPGGCGFQFCWVCLAPYAEILRSGSQNHDTSCSHYRALAGH